MRYYEYRHTVSLEETNATGNVYFANHLRWQGRCRELFLREHAAGVLDQLTQDLRLLTVRCSCEYLLQFVAFDEISIRLFLEDVVLNRVVFRFEYWKVSGASEELAAKGNHEIACMKYSANGTFESTHVPADLMRALEPYWATSHSVRGRNCA